MRHVPRIVGMRRVLRIVGMRRVLRIVVWLGKRFLEKREKYRDATRSKNWKTPHTSRICTLVFPEKENWNATRSKIDEKGKLERHTFQKL